MPNATTQDARADYMIYRHALGALTRDEVNEALVKQGHAPVSPRTFGHYRKLYRAAAARYIPINRFDVARASRPYDNFPDLGRYDYRDTRDPVTVTFVDLPSWPTVTGHTTAAGDIGALIELPLSTLTQELPSRPPRRGDSLMVQYGQGVASEPATLVDVDLDTDPVSIEVQHRRLVSLAALGSKSLPTLTRAHFTLTAEDDSPTTLDVVGRRLYYFFELIEGVRSLINVAVADTAAAPYAPPPVVSQVRVSSPAVVTLDIVETIVKIVPWGLLTVLLTRLPSMRRDWHEGTRQRSDAQRSEVALATEWDRQEFQSSIISELRNRLDTGTIPDDVLLRHIEQHVLKPTGLLASSNVKDISVTESDTDTTLGEG